MNEITFSIKRHQTILLSSERPLVVISGQNPIWITQEGNPRDFIVSQGKSIEFLGEGQLVTQALSQDTGFVVRTPHRPNVLNTYVKEPFFALLASVAPLLHEMAGGITHWFKNKASTRRLSGMATGRRLSA